MRRFTRRAVLTAAVVLPFAPALAQQGAAAPVVGVAPDDVQVGTRVKATLRRMKLGHEGDIYYSQKFVVDPAGAAS